MKKILLLSEIFPPIVGGSGNWFYELYSRLDYDITVACQHVENRPTLEQDRNLKIHRLPMTPKSYNHIGLSSFAQLKYYFLLIKKTHEICVKEKIEIIHCGKILPESLVALFLKIFFGYKYIVFIHGEEIESALLSREYKYLVSKTLKYSDHIICNSNNSVKLLSKWGNDLLNKTDVLYPGVNVDYFKIIPNLESPYADKTLIITVSRLQKRKGHDYLIKAIPKIREKIPNIHYVIIGNGEEKESLKIQINDAGLQDCVELVDNLSNDDIVNYYNYADLFVLPNRRVGNDIEGLGIVLLEAQACGTMVLAGDSGGTLETISEETGAIIDCTNVDNIALNIISILLDPSKVKETGKKARLHIENKFSWSAQIEKSNKIFEGA